MNQYQYEVGDIVKLKKQHPCGSHEWEILRVGADFRLKCTGCGHQIMIARKQVEKNTKGTYEKVLKNHEKWENAKKCLKVGKTHAKIYLRDILSNSLLLVRQGARDQKEVKAT